MHVLIGIALKSVLAAGLTLGLLGLMKQRSASERSWVAHIGLLALVIMAFAPLVLPSWHVEAPALLGQAPAVEASVQAPASKILPGTGRGTSVAGGGGPQDLQVSTVGPHHPDAARRGSPPRPGEELFTPAAAATAVYALPAAILLFITLLALARLIALRARAEVLVDGHWLSALARAQRRMGFKHGTALLTSNELSSPISWGLMRPVILLNDRAVEASGEAEAIIAHELAHVARMDWVKLLLARIATALFWFNPLVWMLAREAHQLREEAADDAVLAADIADTDYAQLLVGVARHECPGLLLGAHGVAPSRSSLARRVARVLDGGSVRGPVARSFALAAFAGAVLTAAPLAAITLAPGDAAKKGLPMTADDRFASINTSEPYYVGDDTPTDLPHLIVNGVSTSVATVTAAVALDGAKVSSEARAETLAAARAARDDALVDAQDAIRDARAEVRARGLSRGHFDQIIEMKAAGVDPDYVNALRAAQPRLRAVDPANFAGMKSVGVTPQFARELAVAGLRNLDANQLAAARAVGLTGDYARAMIAAGVPPNLDDYIQLRAIGVPSHYVISIRKSGHSVNDPDKIVQMWAVGVKPGDLKVMPVPPKPPRVPLPARPAASPPDWDEADADGG